MKLSTRLILLVLTTLFGVLLVGGYGVIQLRQSMQEARRAQIENLLGMAVGMLDSLHKQETAGKLSTADAQARAAEAIVGLRRGDNYLFARDAEDRFVAHVNPDRVGKLDKGTKMPDGRYVVELYRAALAKQGKTAFVEILQAKPGEKAQVAKLNGVTVYEPWGWTLGTGFFVDDIEAAIRAHVLRMAGVALAVLVFAIGFALHFSRWIRATLGGEPAYASSMVTAVARGDLSQHLAPAPAGSLMAALGAMQQSLRSMVGEVVEQVGELNASAHRIGQTMQDIARASETSAEATTATAASVEEMAVSVGLIAESAIETETHAGRSVSTAAQGDRQVRSAVDEIRQISRLVESASGQIVDLAGRTQEIGSVAREIREIADQTNLLALNAAIEAARAGEVGAGFAVVADEVRKLAERTTRATQSISETIRVIQSDTGAMVESIQAIGPRVNTGVELAQAASASLQAISDVAEATLAEIRDVAQATTEQRTASNGLASQIERIAAMTEESDRAVHGASQAAASLGSMADSISASVGRFRL
ncbi:methyl-accepting chemotaxis protein [Uliginosibacterium paludis]|uniref:Methyl-accepting chemotaxis protein n=1 Tax=Uliginosibacterium paludis TaxID=1615952 RepID=A0ABV2CU99_9RHOO